MITNSIPSFLSSPSTFGISAITPMLPTVDPGIA